MYRRGKQDCFVSKRQQNDSILDDGINTLAHGFKQQKHLTCIPLWTLSHFYREKSSFDHLRGSQ